MDDASRSRGYGLIQFEDEGVAKCAIDLVNGKVMNGGVIYAAPFIPRKQRSNALSVGVGGSLSFTNCYAKNFSCICSTAM